MYSFGLHAAILAKEKFKVVVKGLVETAQGDISHTLFIIYKSGQMLVRPLVRIESLLYPVHSDAFLEFFVMFSEQCQQSERFLADAHYGILYQLRRDESQTDLNPVVMSGNFFCQSVYGTIDDNGILAASIGASLFRIPDGRIDGHFCAYLFLFGINAHFA